MAINQVYYRPKVWSPAYNPIIWSFSSTQNYQSQFSYIIDLYVNSTTASTYRIKQSPNPSGNCVIDISQIMQGYANYNLFSAEYESPLTQDYKDSADICSQVFIKVGEEYSILGNPILMYNGIGALGNPTYAIYATYSTTNYNTSNPVRVLPAALDKYTNMDHMTSTASQGIYYDYIMNGTGNGKFLKTDSNIIEVGNNDHHTLTFLNWNDDGPGAFVSPVLQMQVNFYDQNGATFGSGNYWNTTGNGGGPQLLQTYTTATFSYQTSMLTFKCGPTDLGISGLTLSYYEMWAECKTQSTASTNGVRCSEIVRFNITDYSCNLYPKVRLSWLNYLGGRDYYNFTMFYESTSNSEEENYNQTQMNWDGFLPVVIDNNLDTSANWRRGGNKSFNKVVKRRFTIMSDWLLQDRVDFLSGIPQSPSVWAYIGDDPIPVTITITNTDYTESFVKQKKLVQVTFNCEVTKYQQKQNI
jgi:hypothetical protein